MNTDQNMEILGIQFELKLSTVEVSRGADSQNTT